MTEQLKESAQPIARLKNLFFPGLTLDERTDVGYKVHMLEGGAYIKVEYRFPEQKSEKPILSFNLYNVSETLLLGFDLGEDGLEDIESGSWGLSFRDSEEVKVSRFGIGHPEGHLTLRVDKNEGWEKFQGLAPELADWAEKLFKEGKVGKIPVKVMID